MTKHVKSGIFAAPRGFLGATSGKEKAMATEKDRESGTPPPVDDLDEVIDYLMEWRRLGEPPDDSQGKMVLALVALANTLWDLVSIPTKGRIRKRTFLALDGLVIRARRAMEPFEKNQHALKMLALFFVKRPELLTVYRNRHKRRVDFVLQVGPGDARRLIGQGRPARPVFEDLAKEIQEKRGYRRVRVRVHESTEATLTPRHKKNPSTDTRDNDPIPQEAEELPGSDTLKGDEE